MPTPITPVSIPVRIGLIGCGQIGRLHAQRIVARPDAKLVALCDPDKVSMERLRDAASLSPETPLCERLDDLLALDGLDAVVIGTPTSLHFDQVRACRARGLHVLCEKPLADTRERIVTLIGESEAGGPLLSVAYQRRHGALYRTVRREIQSGKWGAVRSVASHNCERWQQVQALPGMWRDDPQINPGGFIGDAGSHKLDIVFFVTGLLPREVFAFCDRQSCRVEIVTMLSARLSGGVPLGMSFVGNAQHFREEMQFCCTEADVLIRNEEIWIARENHLEKLTDWEPESNPIAGLIECLTKGAEDIAPARCALPVFDFTHAVLESSRTEHIVRI